MKQNTNNSRRSRGRNVNRGRNGKLIVMHDGQQVIEGKTRGQLVQTMEKYLSHAREAQAGGDRITAEGYFQHADHYYRLINLLNEAMATSLERSDAPEIESGIIETKETEVPLMLAEDDDQTEVIAAAS